MSKKAALLLDLRAGLASAVVPVCSSRNDERASGLTTKFLRSHPLWELTWAQGPGRGTAGKLVTAIAAGKPPEVTWVDGPAVAA